MLGIKLQFPLHLPTSIAGAGHAALDIKNMG
jgi:hypothetical protein